jgi:hypothetical protein
MIRRVDGGCVSGSIVEACDYIAPYGGNFVPSLLAVGQAVREQLGLDYVCAFPEEARDRPWVRTMQGAGFEPRFLPASRGIRTDVRALEAIARPARARLLRTHFTRFDLLGGIVARRLGARSVEDGPRRG